jgi:hypothetical protein
VVRSLPVLVLVLLVLTGTAPVAASPAGDPLTTGDAQLDAASTEPAGAPATAASPTIRVDTALSLTPEAPGSIGVVQTFEMPGEVTALQVTLDQRVTVTASEGFTRTGERTWEWDGETASPTLTYEKAANKTAEVSGPHGADGSYLYADVGPWALVRTPNVGLQYRYRGTDPVTVSRSTRVDGEGAVGGATAFLGAQETYTREVNGQRFRLVVPAAATLESSPDRILRAMANASRELQVGDRDPELFAVAAPTTGNRWAVEGLQVGSHDFWVQDSQEVDAVGNAWLHEYVHTRQSFATATSGKWFTEASATWYAALLSLEEGATFADFERFLSRGEEGPEADSVLSEPSTWQSNGNYWKGALVLGELDRRIRLDSNQSASLQTVVRSLNGRTEEITNEDIVAEVGSAGSSSTERVAQQFTTTSETPETWGESAHRKAFGSRPARMQLQFDTGTDVQYAGPYRNATAESPIRLATHEELKFRATVTNVGDATGDYEVLLRVDDEVVASRNGTLAPAESATVRLRYRFPETGEYTVSVAGQRLDVRVREPATPTVTRLALDRSTVSRGGTVTATATVENGQPVPGNRTVVFTRDGEAMAERTVSLGPGERRNVSAEVGLPAAGDHRIGAGERSVRVRVTTATSGTQGTSEVPVPGFGVPATVMALGALIGLCRRFPTE